MNWHIEVCEMEINNLDPIDDADEILLTKAEITHLQQLLADK